MVESIGEYSVTLRWHEVSAPDLWGYRVRYEPLAGGGAIASNLGPATSVSLPLPWAGAWRISVAAYDAMGMLSAVSLPIQVTTTANAPGSVYVPLVRR
jgi:hypothetical protein